MLNLFNAGQLNTQALAEGHHRYLGHNTGLTYDAALQHYAINPDGQMADHRHFPGASRMQGLPHGNGSAESQALLLLGYCHLYQATGDQRHLTAAVNYWGAFMATFYVGRPAPITAQRWACYGHANAKEPAAAHHPVVSEDPAASGFLGVEFTWANGFTAIPHGAPYWGEYLDLASFAFSGALDWQAINATVTGTTYPIDWIITGSGERVAADGTVLSSGHPLNERGYVQLQDQGLTGSYRLNFAPRLPVEHGGTLIGRGDPQMLFPLQIPALGWDDGASYEAEAWFADASHQLWRLTGESQYLTVRNAVLGSLNAQMDALPTPLDYSPGLLSFQDAHQRLPAQCNPAHELPLLGQQSPLIFCLGYSGSDAARLGNLLSALTGAQQWYASQFGVTGPIAAAYTWDRWLDYPYGGTGNFGMFHFGASPVWDGYQGRAFTAACRAWFELAEAAQAVPSQLATYCQAWVDWLIGFRAANAGQLPSSFPSAAAPGVAAEFRGDLLASWLSGACLAAMAGASGDLRSLIEGCVSELQAQYLVTTTPGDAMSGAWSAQPAANGVAEGAWSGEILRGLGLYLLYRQRSVQPVLPPAADPVLPFLPAGLDYAYYDASVMSSLWQDAAGTVPVTAPSQLIGRIDDLSGNGHHLVQPDNGRRMTLADVLYGGINTYYFELFGWEFAEGSDSWQPDTLSMLLAGFTTYADPETVLMAMPNGAGFSWGLTMTDDDRLHRKGGTEISVYRSGLTWTGDFVAEGYSSGDAEVRFTKSGTSTAQTGTPFTPSYTAGAKVRLGVDGAGGKAFWGGVYAAILVAADLTTEQKDAARAFLISRYAPAS